MARGLAEQRLAADCLQPPLCCAPLRLPAAAEGWRSASTERRRVASDRLEETTMWYSAVGCIVTLILSLLVAPLAAEAQPPTHVHRIGVLTGITRERDRNVKAFLEGMRTLGYVEG